MRLKREQPRLLLCSHFSILCTLLLRLRFPVVTAEQEIVAGPIDASVLLGKTVTFACKVSMQKGAVQWMKNGFGLGTNRELPFFPRYTMVGSVSNGEYNLKIENVTIADDDVYACQIGESEGEPTVISSSAKLTVLVRPTTPKLLERGESSLNAIAGEPLRQACVVRRGKPPPRIGWAIAADVHGREIVAWLAEAKTTFGALFKQHNIGSQPSLAATVDKDVQRDGDVHSTSSNISFIPRPEDDKKFLVCISQHETFQDRVEIDTVRLNLQYAPRVRLSWANPGRLREGAPALLACNVDARPLEGLTITWFRNENKLSRHTTDMLDIKELKMEDHKSSYTCQAMNAIGTSKDTTKLDVTFGPRILSSQQDKEANIGESVSLQCEATGNPTPQIFWSRAGDDHILAKGEILRIDTVSGWQQGNYICTAVVEGFPHATLSHQLFIRGAPSVSVAEEQQAAVGATALLICRVSGRPKAREIVWWKDGEKLPYTAAKHEIHQLSRDWGVEAKLNIMEVAESDFGIYNCSANNGMGEDSGSIRLRRRTLWDWIALREYHFLLPLLAAFLLLLFCLCCCIFCRRRSQHKKSGSKFTDDQSDVTVKCEALDVQYFPDMYSGPLENGNIITSKAKKSLLLLEDYISIPQNNPDLDFAPAPSTGLYPKYLDNSISDYNARYEPHSYGSFVSGVSTPNGIHVQPNGDIFLNTTNGALSDVKMTLVPAGVGVGVDGSPLETLQEINNAFRGKLHRNKKQAAYEVRAKNEKRQYRDNL